MNEIGFDYDGLEKEFEKASSTHIEILTKGIEEIRSLCSKTQFELDKYNVYNLLLQILTDIKIRETRTYEQRFNIKFKPS